MKCIDFRGERDKYVVGKVTQNILAVSLMIIFIKARAKAAPRI